MRLLTLTKWLVLGGSAAALLNRSRSNRSVTAQDSTAPKSTEPDLMPASMDIDPGDPVQGFDEASELGVDPLDVDAMSSADAEAAQDLALLETELDERAMELDTPAETQYEAIEESLATKDDGDLYGVHTPAAFDRDLPDGDTSFNEGENWVEALSASATEFGPGAEQDVDVTDDGDEPPHRTDTRDIPVADRGSAGIRGM